MLRREVGSTFSDVWYRVEHTRPRLSPHAHVSRHTHSGTVGYIVEDPAGGNYYRLSEPAYFFLGLLDGQRTVAEAWDACIAQRGDAAPTQRECLDLLSKLQLYGLLLGELPLAADMVYERKRQSRQRARDRRTGKWLFPSVPLVNPEPFLERHKAILKLAFSPLGLCVWLAVVAVALWHVAVGWRELGSANNFLGLLNPDNLLLLSVSFVVMRALHEMGHAAACKALGGRVTEIGVMLVVFFLPLPYCDASSSWRFPRARDRIIVGAGGMLVEMFVAAICAIIWSYAQAEWVRSVCYNVMVLSGVTTLIFNLNPLLRYDGYYMLSDLVGSANLAQRSRELWRYILQRTLFGVRSVKPPEVRGAGEAWFLGVYGLLSAPYRVVVMFSLLMLFASRYMGLGIVLTALMVVAWVIWPALKGIGFLASAPQLMGHRARAITVSTLLICGLTAFLGFVPMPMHSYAMGTVEPVVMKALRAAENGFLQKVAAQPGQKVHASDPVFILTSDEIATDLGTAEARVKQARAEYEKAALRGTRPEERIASREIERVEADRDRMRQRSQALTLTAPADGVFIMPSATVFDPANLVGRYFTRGSLLGIVASTDDVIVRVALSDKDAAFVFQQSDLAVALRDGGIESVDLPVQIRAKGQAGLVLDGRIVRVTPAGSREMLDPSLSSAAGGEITPDPEDTSGRKSLAPQFVIEIKPETLPETWKPGLRARVRFELPSRPLAVQWWRLARQYLKGRLG